MNEKEFLVAIKEKLNSENEQQRMATVSELASLALQGGIPLLIGVLDDASPRVREQAVNGFCAYPAYMTFPIFETLLRIGANANHRSAAMEAFPRYGAKATPYLCELLKDYNEEVRMFSAVILGELADSESVEPLIEALKDSDENVRHAAVEALGAIADPRAVQPLIGCLQEDFWIQYPAVVALGAIGDPAAKDSLAELLEDEMLGDVAAEIIELLGEPACANGSRDC